MTAQGEKAFSGEPDDSGLKNLHLALIEKCDLAATLTAQSQLNLLSCLRQHRDTRNKGTKMDGFIFLVNRIIYLTLQI